MIRIGLSTNSSSVSITTGDSSLVAYSPDEPMRMLASNRVSVAARSYRPPEVEQYRFEIQNLPTADEANKVAKEIREATGESALVSVDPATNTWKVWIGSVFDSTEDAEQFKLALAEKGFEEVTLVTEKKVQPSEDAIALSQQLRTAGKSDVRSLIRTTGAAQPMGPDVVNPGLREVVVNGISDVSKYSSLKSVSFGSRLSPLPPACSHR